MTRFSDPHWLADPGKPLHFESMVYRNDFRFQRIGQLSTQGRARAVSLDYATGAKGHLRLLVAVVNR